MKLAQLSGLAALLVAAVPGAQSTQVIPAGLGYDSSGGGIQWSPIAGGTQGIRTMQVVQASAMGFANQTITKIELRNTSFWAQSYASDHSVRVSLGYTQLNTDQLPTQFASIPSAPLTDVYIGSLSLPDSTTQQIPRDWTVSIPLTTPWTYDPSLGNFVLEIEAAHIGGDLRQWSADAHVRNVGGGGIQRTGQGCFGFRAQVSTVSDLVPGGMLRFVMDRPGLPNASGFALLGFPHPSYPLDLGPQGAPSCTLQFPHVLTQPATLMGNLHHAIGSTEWPIPPLPGIVGLSVDHQVYMHQPWTTPDLALSTAHRITIGSPLPAGPQATNSLRGSFGDASGTLPQDPGGWILRLTLQ